MQANLGPSKRLICLQWMGRGDEAIQSPTARCGSVVAAVREDDRLPSVSGVHLVEKTAVCVARAKSQERGEKLLAAAVRKQRAAMTRKGIPAHEVERQCRALENAIRARLFRLILTSPTENDTG